MQYEITTLVTERPDVGKERALVDHARVLDGLRTQKGSNVIVITGADGPRSIDLPSNPVKYFRLEARYEEEDRTNNIKAFDLAQAQWQFDSGPWLHFQTVELSSENAVPFTSASVKVDPAETRTIKIYITAGAS